MTAQPIIEYAQATKSTTGILIESLIRTNARGMVQMRASLTSSCTTIPLNCTTTINTATVTTTGNFSTSGVVIGLRVTGTGIATDTYVTAIASTTSLTINKNATATGTVTLTFGPDDVRMARDWCVEKQNTTYISNLYNLVNTYRSGTTATSSACLRAYACASEEDCDTLTCTTWNSGYTTGKTSIPMETEFGVTPIAVSSLTLTPGNGTILASWGDVNQTTSIWTYQIMLKQDTTTLASGFVVTNSITISNLTNETEYKVSVRPRSFDGRNGPMYEQTATPTAPVCTQPSCTMTIV